MTMRPDPTIHASPKLILRAAVENGITFFDTAEVYAQCACFDV